MQVGVEIRFGAYRADLGQRLLFRGGEPVALTPRSFDILALLLQNAARLVSKDELLQGVWGKTIVEDGTLTWHVHALRQALANGDEGARYIDTIPKRGYRFVAPLLEAKEQSTAIPLATPAASARRKIWIAAVLVFAAATAVGLAMFLLQPAAPALPFAERDWLLVADFENQTGDPRFDRALLTAFSVGLEQSRFVHLYPRSRVMTTLARMQLPLDSRVDEMVAREICAREGIRALVSAAITRTGTEYALAARLIDPKSGESVRAYAVPVEDESHILAGLQEIATEVRRDLGESLSAIAASDRSLAEVTTPVLTALQRYSEGVQEWQMAHYGDARNRFEAAVAADPDFAMANAALGRLMYGYTLNRPDLGAEYFQRALALASKTTDRERAIIRADFAAARGRAVEARQLYRTLLGEYPLDLELHGKLGDLESESGNYAAAASEFEAGVAIDPISAKMLMGLGIARANRGEFAAALGPFERALTLDPMLMAHHNFNYNYGFLLFGAGREADARRVFTEGVEKLQQGERGWRALGLVAQYYGRYAAAAESFIRAIALPDSSGDSRLVRSRNQSYLAAMRAAQGRRDEAVAQLRLAAASLDAHGKVNIRFRARIAKDFARLGDLSSAGMQRQRVLADADASDPRDRVLTRIMESEIELASGQKKRAAELIGTADRAVAGTELPLLLDSLARVSAAAGDAPRAVAVYREIIAMRGNWLAWEAQQVWLLAHLELAKLLRAGGDAAGAKGALAPLLAIWKDGDADMIYAQQARLLARELGMTP